MMIRDDSCVSVSECDTGIPDAVRDLRNFYPGGW